MATDLDRILKLKVPVIVQLGQRPMSVDDVMSLGPGAIIDLNKSADTDQALLVNNRSVGRGEAVKVGENYGVRVISIGTPKQVVSALGGSESSA